MLMPCNSLNAGNMLAQGERCSSTSPSTVSRLQGLGGLFAAGILGGMENVKGIRGWRWVSSVGLVYNSRPTDLF